MLFTNLEVTFAYSAGSESRVFLCSRIIFGLEYIGEIEEHFDLSLSEEYEDARQRIEIWVKLNQEEAIWLKNFLIAGDKQLTIDNTTYNVVNAEKKIKFPLYKGSNIGSFPKLKFRRKELGILDPNP